MAQYIRSLAPPTLQKTGAGKICDSESKMNGFLENMPGTKTMEIDTNKTVWNSCWFVIRRALYITSETQERARKALQNHHLDWCGAIWSLLRAFQCGSLSLGQLLSGNVSRTNERERLSAECRSTVTLQRSDVSLRIVEAWVTHCPI